MVFLCATAMAMPVRAAWQSRDTSTRPATVGTAVIAGTIVSDEATPKSLRRVMVTLSGAAGTAARVAVTDDQGRFAFTRLPAGSFLMNAKKTGYVTSYFGATRLGRGPGVPIAVADGQRQSVQMRLTRGAVLTGSITDQFGRPASGITVQAYRVSAGLGTAPATFAGASTTTDDRGVYRIYGLAPADYVISATRRTLVSGEIRTVTSDEVQWALQQIAGVRTGTGAQNAAVTPPEGRPIGYAPVLFPGTADLSTAQRITLGPGEERGGLSFTMQYVPTARIEGTLIDVNGQLIPDATALLVPVGGSINDVAAYDLGIMASAGQSGGSGRFSIGGVAPGRYQVQARSGGANQPRWGQLDIAVDGQDQSGLTVTLHPGAVVSGTMTFAGMSVPPENLGGIRPMLNRTQTQQAMIALGPTSTVQPDRTFTMTNVMPGSYNLRVSATPAGVAGAPGWSLKSAMVQGRDVADVPLLIGPGEAVAEVVITFTDQPTEISGTLLDAAGRPNSAYSIVVFSTDRRFWLQTSRRTQAVRPATNGTFKIAGLPAGDYLLTAVTDYDPTDLYDPSFLEQLQAAAYKLTLADGEKKKQDLKLAGR